MDTEALPAIGKEVDAEIYTILCEINKFHAVTAQQEGYRMMAVQTPGHYWRQNEGG